MYFNPYHIISSNNYATFIKAKNKIIIIIIFSKNFWCKNNDSENVIFGLIKQFFLYYQILQGQKRLLFQSLCYKNNRLRENSQTFFPY